MPTLEANKVRLALDKSSKLRLLDAADATRVEIPQGAGVAIECAVFDGPVLEENLITDFDDVTSVQIIIRAVSPNGAVLLEKSVDVGAFDRTDMFFSDWEEEKSQQFTFSFDAEETTITLPSSGKLPIYFVVRAITPDNEYNLGFGYGEIVDIGIVDFDVPPPSSLFTSVFVNSAGVVQNVGPINYAVGQLKIAGVIVYGASTVTSTMLAANVFSTAHSWSGVQTFTTPVLGAATGTSIVVSGNVGFKVSGIAQIGDPPGSGYPGIWFGANTASPSYLNYAFLYDSAAGTGGTILNAPAGQNILLRVNNVLIAGISATGVAITGNISIGGNQILSTRNTGWSAMTGTSNKVTVYDTASVTLAQLAGRVMAIQAALTTHGLFGT